MAAKIRTLRFFELTPRRTKEYFLWYTEEIPNRIALLWEYMKLERPKSQPFDYSPESLIPLWDWYETKIKQIPSFASGQQSFLISSASPVGQPQLQVFSFPLLFSFQNQKMP